MLSLFFRLSLLLALGSQLLAPSSQAQSYINGFPSALGQTTSAASLPVVMASDDLLPVTTNSPIISGPPSAQSLAATGTFQFSVQGGTVVALTLTNAPAATATWVGTVGFQWSANGSTWNTLSATPRSTLPGSSAVQASSTTAPGLWLASLPANAAFVRYNVTAWTSGTIWGFVEPWNQTNGVIQLPWTPTVTSGQTLAGWFDASGINSLLIRISAVTTTVVTVQGTNDPSGTDVDTINVHDTKTANASGASTITAANTFRALLVGHKWVRVQVTTTGTVLTVQGITATLGQIFSLSSSGNSVFVATNNASVNVAQVSGNASIGTQANGSTNRALGVTLATAVAQTDQSATAFAGSGRVNGTVVASAAGGGVSCAFNLNVTVTTLGTATALVPVLAISTDSGTTYTDVWTCTPITATTQIRVPAIPMEGRRRWSIMSVGGTSTTIPATITAQELPGVNLIQRQFVDIFSATNPTASVVNGVSTPSTLVSTTISSTSGVAVIEGCKLVTITGVFTGGTPTTAPVYALQTSDDATNWFTTATTISPTAAGTFRATATNVCARYARLIITTASAGGTAYGVTYTSIYGIN